MPQEPSYRVTLPGGGKGKLVVQSRPTTDRSQIVRISGSGVSGRPADASVEVDENGFVARGRMEEQNGPVREAIRSGDSYLVRDGGGEGALPLNRPLLTTVDLVSWLGLRVKSRKPTYFWLLAFDRNGLPRLDSTLVETLPTPPTERRLRVTITDLRDGTKRVGDVRIDLATGAVAQIGPPLVDMNLALTRRPFEDPPGQHLLAFGSGYLARTSPEGDGYRVRLLQDGRQRSELVQTDRDLAPVQVTQPVGKRNLIATVTGNKLVWQLDGGESVRIPSQGDQTWFPPHLVVTQLWEDRGYFSLAAGQKRDGTLLLALPDPEPFTLERFLDEGTSRRYKLTAKSFTFDLTTDGRRLIRLTGGDGLEIVRD